MRLFMMLMPSRDKAVLDLAGAGADEIGTRRRRRVGGLWPQKHSRRSHGEPHRIAAIQRQIRHRARADGFGHAGIVGLDGHRDRLDRHGLRDRADLQGEVGPDGLVDTELDPRFECLLKPGCSTVMLYTPTRANSKE